MITPVLWLFNDLVAHSGYALAVACILVATRAQIRMVFDRYLRREVHSIPYEFILLGCAMGVLVFITLSFMLRMHTGVGLIAGCGSAVTVPILLKRHIHNKYLLSFDLALIDGLTAIASAIKAGLTLPDALRICAGNGEDVLAKELTVVLKEYRLGVSIEDALDNLRQRVSTENANIAFGAMIISSQLGGNLPTMLTRIAHTIRERDKVRGKLRSLTAQGRMQAILVSSAPPGLALMLYLWDSGKFALLTDTFAGQVMFGVAIALEILGIYAMRRMMRLEI